MRLIGSTAALALIAAVAAGAAVAGSGPRGGPEAMEGFMPGPRGLDFAAIDSDGDGSLSRAELQARAVARLGTADANGDGALDRDELILALGSPRHGFADVFARDPAEAMADRVLALAGATESGRVEVAVLADRRVNVLLAFADTDRDAAVSETEADAMRERARDWREHRREGRRGHGPDRPERFGMAPDGPPQPAPPAPAPAVPEAPRG